MVESRITLWPNYSKTNNPTKQNNLSTWFRRLKLWLNPRSHYNAIYSKTNHPTKQNNLISTWFRRLKVWLNLGSDYDTIYSKTNHPTKQNNLILTWFRRLKVWINPESYYDVEYRLKLCCTTSSTKYQPEIDVEIRSCARWVTVCTNLRIYTGHCIIVNNKIKCTYFVRLLFYLPLWCGCNKDSKQSNGGLVV